MIILVTDSIHIKISSDFFVKFLRGSNFAVPTDIFRGVLFSRKRQKQFAKINLANSYLIKVFIL